MLALLQDKVVPQEPGLPWLGDLPTVVAGIVVASIGIMVAIALFGLARYIKTTNKGFRHFDTRVTDAVLKWAEQHPYPDKRVFAMANGKTLTPKELAHEIEERTEIGREHLEMLRHVVEVDDDLSPEDLIGMLESSHTTKPQNSCS